MNSARIIFAGKFSRLQRNFFNHYHQGDEGKSVAFRHSLMVKEAKLTKYSEKLMTISSDMEDLIKHVNDKSLGERWDEVLMRPMNYFTEVPHFSHMTRFGEVINHWVKIPNETVAKVTEITEMFYADLLVIDDIVDDSDVRKNRPASHIVYGIPWTLNSIKMNIFLTLEKIMKLCPDVGVEMYTKFVLDNARSSGIELYWRDNGICPELPEYRNNLLLKNYGFYDIQSRLVQICGGNNQDFSRLTALLCAFQVVLNDYSDYTISELSEGKTFCDDMSDGKFNFPSVHAINVMGNREALEILRQRTKDDSLKQRFVDILDSVGSLQYTRDYLTAVNQELQEEIYKLGGNPILEKSIDDYLKKF